MAKNKINSFLVAMIIAIVSFFVIFLFFSNAADKFFGVSVKNGDAEIQQMKETVTKTVKESVESVSETAADKLNSTVQKLISTEK